MSQTVYQTSPPITDADWQTFMQQSVQGDASSGIRIIHWVDALCLLQIILLMVNVPLCYYDCASAYSLPTMAGWRELLLLVSSGPLGFLLLINSVLGSKGWNDRQWRRRYCLLITWLAIWGAYGLTPGSVELYPLRDAGARALIDRVSDEGKLQTWAITFARHTEERRLSLAEAQAELGRERLPAYVSALHATPRIHEHPTHGRYIVIYVDHGTLYLAPSSFCMRPDSRFWLKQWRPGVYYSPNSIFK